MIHKKLDLTRKVIILSCLLGVLVATMLVQTVQAVSVPTVKPISVATINPKVLQLAMTAYTKAKNAGVGTQDLLTVVDYSLPSTERRLWVIDMRTMQILHHTHVAHGMGSGGNYATQFSNSPGSRMSSIGLFLTSHIYQGKYGNSLNLIGLDGKFNSNAESRRIVFHKAPYVNEGIIKKINRLGRSFGCFALSNQVGDKIMHTIKDGSLVFTYYPDPKWLSESKWL